MSQPTHVYSIFIRTTPERLWSALTDGALTRQYYFGSAVESDWQPGSPYRYTAPDGSTLVEGQVLAAEPPHRLVTTFQAMWTPEGVAAPPSTVTYEITPYGDRCKLTLLHDGLAPGSALTAGIIEGWVRIFSDLKTFVETSAPVPVGA